MKHEEHRGKNNNRTLSIKNVDAKVGVVYLKNRENHGRPQRTAPRISNRLVELAHIKRGNRVLDLATGTEIVKIFSRLQPLSLLLIAKITNRTH